MLKFLLIFIIVWRLEGVNEVIKNEGGFGTKFPWSNWPSFQEILNFKDQGLKLC
jgi:hypothetical protein